MALSPVEGDKHPKRLGLDLARRFQRSCRRDYRKYGVSALKDTVRELRHAKLEPAKYPEWVIMEQKHDWLEKAIQWRMYEEEKAPLIKKYRAARDQLEERGRINNAIVKLDAMWARKGVSRPASLHRFWNGRAEAELMEQVIPLQDPDPEDGVLLSSIALFDTAVDGRHRDDDPEEWEPDAEMSDDDDVKIVETTESAAKKGVGIVLDSESTFESEQPRGNLFEQNENFAQDYYFEQDFGGGFDDNPQPGSPLGQEGLPPLDNLSRELLQAESSALAESPSPLSQPVRLPKRHALDEELSDHKLYYKLTAKKEKALSPAVLPQLEAKVFEVDEAETFQLRPSHKSKGKLRSRSCKVNLVPTRSAYQPEQAEPRVVDFDVSESNLKTEENLLLHFQLKDRNRPIFVLNDFSVVTASRNLQSAKPVPLHDLVAEEASWDVVVIGDAWPATGVDSKNEAEDDDGPRRVHLTKHERPRAYFHVDGPYIETRSAKYLLRFPARPYEGSISIFRRLLNLFVFARSRYIRGSHSLDSPVRVAETGRLVQKELQRLHRDHARSTADLSWQESLPSHWRNVVETMALSAGPETVLLHSTLPDIPWILPSVYKLIAPFFPPYTFRTSYPKGCQQELQREEAATRALFDKYARCSVNDEHAPIPQVSKARNPVRRFFPPSSDETGTLEIDVYGEIELDTRLLRKGMVLLIRSSPASKSRKTSTRKALHRRGAGSEDEGGMAVQDEDADREDSEEADSDEAGSEDTGDEAEKSTSEEECKLSAERAKDADFWFFEYHYAFQVTGDGNDEWFVHGSWFTVGSKIPALGPYVSPRHLFKLAPRRCDTLSLDSIVAVLDDTDFRFLKPGELDSGHGFFCQFTYSETDGAFEYYPSASSDLLSTCHRDDVEPCRSCEDKLLDLERTEVSNVKTGDRVKYHPDDLVQVRPDIAAGALHGPDRPIRLARLLRMLDEDELDLVEGRYDDSLAWAKVEWLVRATECGVYGEGDYRSERELISTSLIADLDVGLVDGKFNLYHVEVDRLTTDGKLAERLHDLEVVSPPTTFWYSRRISPQVRVDYCRDGKHDGVIKLQRHNLVPADASSVPVCATCESYFRQKDAERRRIDAEVHKYDSSAFRLRSTALYAGGGLLDKGLERGFPALRTSHAVETNPAAAAFLRSNAPEGIEVDVNTVSNNTEDAYHRVDSGSPRPLFISAGAPCQGFSYANRYKRADDLRCFEPFVTLGAFSVQRPLYGLFENVAAFREHALPTGGAARGSFAQLFFSVALRLGYQLRYSIDNAAAYGVPQDRRRFIVQFAAAVALHPSNTIKDAIDDLPEFSYEDCFDGDDTYTPSTIGPAWSSDSPAKYGSRPNSTYELRARSQLFQRQGGQQEYATTAGPTHHLCKATSEVVARRLRTLGIAGQDGEQGNHLDLRDFEPDIYPHLPAWMLKLPPHKQDLWWSRLQWHDRCSTLRTRLSLDGASQGPRIHPEQSRPLSVRELMRLMGLVDAIEVNFASNMPDDSLQETFKLIGNGVPVPLAEAYGRSLYVALLPYLLEHVDAAEKPKENIFEALWRSCGAANLVETATPEAAAKYIAQEGALAAAERSFASEAEEDDVEMGPGRSTVSRSTCQTAPRSASTTSTAVTGLRRLTLSHPTSSTSTSTSATSTSRSPSTFSQPDRRSSTRPTSTESTRSALAPRSHRASTGARAATSVKGKGKERVAVELDSDGEVIMGQGQSYDSGPRRGKGRMGEKGKKKKVTQVLELSDSSDEE
ncbi:hypothetical protein JCM11641_000568 [Rhodosporidiobolus odoratus]